MRYCVNLGDIWVNISSIAGAGGLFTLRTGLQAGEPVQKLIVSDCYNAGTVYGVGVSGSVYFGGLIGGAMYRIAHWLETDGALKISNVFNYGLIVNPYADLVPSVDSSQWTIIAGEADGAFTDLHVVAVYSNIYYRPEIGAKLFGIASLNGGVTGYGTGQVQKVIKGKTTEEFASQAMADLLNAGRTGAEAPWEFVADKAYPTLKFEREGYDPDDDDDDDPTEPTPSAKYAEAFYGGAVTYNDNGTCTITATREGYVIDEIWVDGARLSAADVQGKKTYTTTSAPQIGVFATFGYSVNFYQPTDGTLSVSRVIGDTKSEIVSGSIVHALEILSISYEGSDKLAFDGLEATGADEYKVTAHRDTGGPKITGEAPEEPEGPETPVLVIDPNDGIPAVVIGAGNVKITTETGVKIATVDRRVDGRHRSGH
jgi:hypothetical protein